MTVFAGSRSDPAYRRQRTHISFFSLLRALSSTQAKTFSLAALLQPERISRNVEAETLPIIPAFHGPGGVGDPSGGHGFPAAGATRTAARPLAFRIRSRPNRPLHRSGARLQQSLVRGDRPDRLDDAGLSLSGRRCLQTVRHLHEGLRRRAARAECLAVSAGLGSRLYNRPRQFRGPRRQMVGLGVGILSLRHLFSRRTHLGDVVGDSAFLLDFSDHADPGKRKQILALGSFRPALGTRCTDQPGSALCAALSRGMGHLSPPSPRPALVYRQRRGHRCIYCGYFTLVHPQL